MPDKRVTFVIPAGTCAHPDLFPWGHCNYRAANFTGSLHSYRCSYPHPRTNLFSEPHRDLWAEKRDPDCPFGSGPLRVTVEAMVE